MILIGIFIGLVKLVFWIIGGICNVITFLCVLITTFNIKVSSEYLFRSNRRK